MKDASLSFRSLPFLFVILSALALALLSAGYAFGVGWGLSQGEYLIVGGALTLALIVATYAWLRRQLLMPLEQMYHALRRLAQGKPTVLELHDDSPSDLVRMMRVVNQLSAGQLRLARFAQRVGEGELDAKFHPLSTADELGNALLAMRDNLRRSAQRDAQRSWHHNGLAQLSVKLSVGEDYRQALADALTDLADYLGVAHAAVYAVDAHGYVGVARGGYAEVPEADRLLPLQTRLFDQALAQGRAVPLSDLPAGALPVITGLGPAPLSHLVVVPLGGTRQPGVVELGGFRALDAPEVAFAEQVGALLGNALAVGMANARTRELLEQSERLNASLQRQREELHQNLERLVATQQDMKYAQRLLQEASELNSKLYEEAQDGKGISDGYIFSDCNATLVQLLGSGDKDTVKGRTLLEFSPAQQPDMRSSDVVLREHVELALAEGRDDFEWQFARPGGGSWYGEVNLLLLSGDRTRTLVYSVRDITARKRAELDMRHMNAMLLERENELWQNIVALTEAQQAKSKAESELSETEKRLQQISNNAPAIIFRFVTDRESGESRFLFVSAAARRLSGLAVEQWMQFSFGDFLELLHPADRDNLRTRSEQSAEQLKPFEGEARLRTASGEYRWISIQSNPTAVSKSRIVSDGVINDITEIKELIFQIEEKNSELRSQEEELRQNAEELLSVNEELERRNFELQQSQTELRQAVDKLTESEAQLERKVAERTDELRRAKEEADRANQVKSLFLANMSHELRTPLNGILGYAQILHDAPQMPDALRDKIAIVQRSGEHLLSLINEVLDLSKIEAGKMELVPRRFSLPNFLTEVRDMFALRAQSKRLQLSLQVSPDLPQIVVADEVKLRQCIVNLLSNAIKFTQQGSVTLEVYRQRDGRIRFSVSDTGRGIPAERIPDIVRPFKQLASELNTEGGTGLGLAITKSYVEMMGGRLSITSEVGRGSTFAFPIHLEEADPTAALQPLDHDDGHARRVVSYTAERPMRILVVDDNEINREVAIELLRSVGFEVEQAVDGEQAIERFEATHPDMILMDVRMPGISGLEATQQIRQLPGGADVKICAVTASVFEGERKTIYKYGCDDYLPKPFKLAELLGMVKRHLPIDYVTERVSSPQAEVASIVSAELDYPYLAKHLPRGYINHFIEHLEVGDYAEATRRTEALKKDDEQVQAFKRLVLFLLHELRTEQLDSVVMSLRQAR